GSGYSCLAYLHELPIDTLKIDRAFIAPLEPIGRGLPEAELQQRMRRRRHVRAVLGAVAALANRLNLRLVAEGVEAPLQHRLVRRYGCTAAQGYLFSRPIPLPQVLAYVGPPVRQAA